MFKEILESEIIISKGSESKIQNQMDKLFKAYESGELPWQEYYSSTDDYKTYKIVTDDPEGYKKFKKVIDKIL